MTTWIKDDRGNKCSVEYFGSQEAAQKALDSLVNCDNCTNCSDCIYCSYCSDCSYCRDCIYCSSCSDCRSCRYCIYCSSCRSCSYCRYCSDCSACIYCSYCRYCSDCRYCRSCSYCRYKKGDLPAPVIPKIENIHQKIYQAVTATPESLEMEAWHTCNTTHCRGGWVVHLAREAGYALERFFDTALAAQLIYRESGYQINPCRFYDDNDEALADMKRLADLEASKAA